MKQKPKATHILIMFNGGGGKRTWRVYKDGDVWCNETDGRSVIGTGVIDDVVLLPLSKPPVFRLW